MWSTDSLKWYVGGYITSTQYVLYHNHGTMIIYVFMWHPVLITIELLLNYSLTILLHDNGVDGIFLAHH